MRVKIIIPTKNRADLITNQIKEISSIVALRKDDVKVIIVDDNSEASHKVKISAACLDNIGFEFISLSQNVGAPAARNIGAKEGRLSCPTEWLWFLDDDDFVTASVLTKVLNDLEWLDSKVRVALLPCLSNRELVIPHCSNLFEKYRSQGQDVNTSCLILKESLFCEVGFWDETLVAGQDTDLFLRISRIENEAELISDCAIRRHLDSSNRITKSSVKQMVGKYQFIRKHWKTLSAPRLARYVFTLVFFIPYLRKLIGR